MTEKLLKELTKEFNNIKKLEYIKSANRGNTSVNITFANLLKNNKELHKNIENESITIKVKRSYSKAFITLTDMLPNNKDNLNSLFTEKYKFNSIISSKKSIKIGTYYFKLKIDYKEKCIKLIITDYFDNILEDSIYWTFSDLKKRIIDKLAILVVIKAWPDRINNIEYFKYYKMNIYLLKKFDYFISAVDNGYIKIKLKINYQTNNTISYHMSFIITEEDLLSIYDLYR
ncbi:MAG: hypothetical protein IKF19_02855 [Bacilli bacterium]|nr:hypothetical protein [Bacilli bacterium]